MIQSVWVEIPAADIERALRFYTALFELDSVDIVDDGPRRTATMVSTADNGSPGISLNQTNNFRPHNDGVLVYYYAGDDLNTYLDRVEAAGGKIVETKTQMGEAGYYATVQDTEGNLLALYSAQ